MSKKEKERRKMLKPDSLCHLVIKKWIHESFGTVVNNSQRSGVNRKSSPREEREKDGEREKKKMRMGIERWGGWESLLSLMIKRFRFTQATFR